jgi:hypothetical protein
MNRMWREIDHAIEHLTAQQTIVARKHIRAAPAFHVEEPEGCLVQRNDGRTVHTLPLMALRALAWVIAEEHRLILRPEGEYASCLGALNDAEFVQDDALWFLGRAQTLLEKLKASVDQGETDA